MKNKKFPLLNIVISILLLIGGSIILALAILWIFTEVNTYKANYALILLSILDIILGAAYIFAAVQPSFFGKPTTFSKLLKLYVISICILEGIAFFAGRFLSVALGGGSNSNAIITILFFVYFLLAVYLIIKTIVKIEFIRYLLLCMFFVFLSFSAGRILAHTNYFPSTGGAQNMLINILSAFKFTK